MTPETERFLQNADDHLERGQAMLAAGLDEDAGRAAYLAAFHAAQAVIFERTGKILKTHKGVQIEFLRLTKDDPTLRRSSGVFFPGSYDFKAVADSLEWALDATPQGGPPVSETSDSGASLFTAVQEQLDLKLEPQRSEVEFLVVDDVQKTFGKRIRRRYSCIASEGDRRRFRWGEFCFIAEDPELQRRFFGRPMRVKSSPMRACLPRLTSRKEMWRMTLQL